MVVDNRTGAGGNWRQIVASTRCGYTLVIGNIDARSQREPAACDALRHDQDFTPIVHLMDARVRWSSIHRCRDGRPRADALARAQPGKLSYASAGRRHDEPPAGGVQVDDESTSFTSPYKGNAPAITDLLAGGAAMIFATMPTACRTCARASCGVACPAPRARRRCPMLTVAESVPGFEVSNWIGLSGRLDAGDRRAIRRVQRSCARPRSRSASRPKAPNSSRCRRSTAAFRKPRWPNGRRPSGREHQGRLSTSRARRNRCTRRARRSSFAGEVRT